MNRKRPRESALWIMLIMLGTQAIGWAMLFCCVGIFVAIIAGIGWLVRWILPAP